jgi:hypothetical protein
MDDAALRVRPSGLRALVRLRADRERRALLDLRSKLAEKDAAAAARDRAARVLSHEEAARTARESRLYEALPERGPLTAEAMAADQASIGRWSESVETAASRVDAAQVELDAAMEAARDSRAVYAVRARAVRKWTRIQDLIATARRRHAEASDEQETEDEILTRSAAAGERDPIATATRRHAEAGDEQETEDEILTRSAAAGEADRSRTGPC